MQRLLALAGAASVQTSCGSQGERVSDPTVTIPSLPSSIDSSSLPTQPSAVASARPVTTAKPSDLDLQTGYAVVDPMPPPVRCPGLSGSIRPSAEWKQDRNNLVVELSLSKIGRSDASYITTDPPQVSGGRVMNLRAVKDSVVILVQPDPGAGYVNVQIGARCSQGDSHIQATLTLAGARQPGSAIPVSLADTW